MKAVAAFLPNWIGDVVMATPAIRALRRHFPNARLVAVGKPYVADTLAGAPWFDDTVLIDRKGPPERRFWDAASALRQLGVTSAVLFPNSFRAALLARVSGCREVVGFARYGRDALLSKRLYPARGAGGKPKPSPALDDYNRVVGLLGVPDPGHRMELFTLPVDEAAAAAVWAKLRLHRFRRVVGLNPGGAFGASKHWPAAYFAEVARGLAARGAGVLVLCGPQERDAAAEIARLAGHPAVASLSDAPLSLGLTKAVARRLALLVTTDSGPRHVAAAFGVSVVTLYGPTHQAWTDTHFDRDVPLQKKVPCGPCQLRACPLDHRCMTALLPAEVLAAAGRLLSIPAVTDDAPRQERRHAG